MTGIKSFLCISMLFKIVEIMVICGISVSLMEYNFNCKKQMRFGKNISSDAFWENQDLRAGFSWALLVSIVIPLISTCFFCKSVDFDGEKLDGNKCLYLLFLLLHVSNEGLFIPMLYYYFQNEDLDFKCGEVFTQDGISEDFDEKLRVIDGFMWFGFVVIQIDFGIFMCFFLEIFDYNFAKRVEEVKPFHINIPLSQNNAQKIGIPDWDYPKRNDSIVIQIPAGKPFVSI